VLLIRVEISRAIEFDVIFELELLKKVAKHLTLDLKYKRIVPNPPNCTI
jgi:hypothetical protein